MSGEFIHPPASPLNEVSSLFHVARNQPDDKQPPRKKKEQKKKDSPVGTQGDVEDLLDHKLEELLEDDAPLVTTESEEGQDDTNPSVDMLC